MKRTTEHNIVSPTSVGEFVRVGHKRTVGYRLAANGCWEWEGGRDSCGYGQAFNHRLGRTDKAHRVIWERAYGPLPPRTDRRELDHLCRNPGCVNPDHLEIVTHTENQRRTRKTHCRHGHEYTPENTLTYVKRSGLVWRTCRTCMRERASR